MDPSEPSMKVTPVLEVMDVLAGTGLYEESMFGASTFESISTAARASVAFR